MQLSINTLKDIEAIYDTIIWDLRQQNAPIVLGGKQFCPHQALDTTGRCELCGAYLGKIQQMQYSDYQQKILTELAVSPSKDHTIILTSRSIGKEAVLKHPAFSTPDYDEFVYLNRYGNFFENKPQKVLYLIHNSKSKTKLSHSNYIVSKRWCDSRLFCLGERTLVIYPHKNWLIKAENIDLIYDKDFTEFSQKTDKKTE